ncbi:glycosyltransferase family 8 protein [Ceratobasidium sp. AG-I]|nr:glycosyltransferase family 8 protein [Ceratobasidium sp. AG-I]
MAMQSSETTSTVVSRDGYRFTPTQDWFSGNIPQWQTWFAHVTRPSPRALEIGSWEGRSAVFTLLNLGKGDASIVCIDHFDSFHTDAGRERFDKISHNLRLAGRPHRILPHFSVPGLMILLEEATHESEPGFDWLYVDGSHKAADTFLDGELAWRLARNGAVIVFDDYRWNQEPIDSPHHPKPGVDAFMTLHRGEFEILSGSRDGEYQMALRKVVDMNIGFAFEGAAAADVTRELGWGINIALALDSAYAMPASVALSSAAQTTQGRITFYVLDCGLSPSDISRLQASLPSDRSDVTLVVLNLPSSSLTTELGPNWAKVDLIRALPVERALYLDADILVRKDLRPLWSTHLGSKLVGAAPDVGHPMGHPSNPDQFPHFNAGVILMDLAKMRQSLDHIFQAARQMKDAHFADQDALNKALRGAWLELSLEWNASGLGTYADRSTPERDALRLAELVDPAIVHFTGPLHPPMADIVNPWVQPYVAKPWGYAGAPGHPYEAEWWSALERTSWSGWKQSEEYEKMRESKASEIQVAGVEKFRKILSL